jgi:hypothetical protein
VVPSPSRRPVQAGPEQGCKTIDGGRTWTKSKFIDEDTGFIDWSWIRRQPDAHRRVVSTRRTAWDSTAAVGQRPLERRLRRKTWKRLEAADSRHPANGDARPGVLAQQSQYPLRDDRVGPKPAAVAAAKAGNCRESQRELDPNRAGIWRSDDKSTWKLTSNGGRAM